MSATLYTPELFATICQRIADGEYLDTICKEAGMPAARTVRTWILDDLHGCATGYARARQLQYEAMEGQIFEISNTPIEGEVVEVGPLGIKTTTRDMLEHRKLQIETRRWLLTKLHPEKYGERKAVDMTITEDEDARKRLIEARERTGK